MLVLGRELDQEIVIDTGHGLINVMVTSVEGNYVKLGVTAPREMPVHRREVYDAIQRDGGRDKRFNKPTE